MTKTPASDNMSGICFMLPHSLLMSLNSYIGYVLILMSGIFLIREERKIKRINLNKLAIS
jgi:hypothetical protein